MEWVSLVIVLPILARAVYTDIKTEKIENWLMITGMAAGLLSAGLRGGLGAVLYSIEMAAIVLLALFFLFVIKGLGAGDIKLLCVLAVFFPDRIISIIVLSFFVGAVIAICRMLFRWIIKKFVSCMRSVHSESGAKPMNELSVPLFIKKEKINFSVPVAAGTFIAFFWR